MKKSRFGIAMLGVLAIYLITVAFIPKLQVSVNTFLMIAIFLAILRLNNRNIVYCFISFGFLAVFLKDTLNLHYASQPLFLGLVILGVFFHYLMKANYEPFFKHNTQDVSQQTSVTHISNQNQVNLKTFFSEDTYHITSQNLKNLTLTVKFGEQNTDLTQANFLSNSPQIYLDVQFGEVNLQIPKHWKINSQASHPLANISISVFSSDSAETINVNLQGNVTTGKVNISY